ncbi:MAG TPA: Coq4 family protein [Candidatus Bathyarchaeia archaeon]|nr:Coq4 family protein [Candidatus Bathyarchaeia archaeon]
MSYEHLANTLKAIAITAPAARAFELTVEFALGQGKDTATVGRLEDHFRDRPAMKACVERMRADPLVRKCFDDRYMGPELDLDELVKYPRGSLGYTFAKVMKHLGYEPHFYGDRPSLVEDTDYATMRVRKTHDFHHIVTGFSMIGPGELGVIAITALQYGYPAFMTLDLGAIALSMMRVEGWGNHVRWVRAGWDMAERIKPLMGVRWEEGLDKPVDVWRKELGVEPIQHGQNSWYEVLAGLEL